MEQQDMYQLEDGVVRISDEVVCVIASMAASEVEGVEYVGQGVVAGLTDKLTNKKHQVKGVRVSISEESAQIDIFLSVAYGQKIHEVAEQVQKNVKRSVEAMTGLIVSQVNVYVQNVVVKKVETQSLEKIEE
ncbi:Uncharacterized conserved protein YloU, alkaline shock protein (Asp23) family [Clostridium collagenovorans DSM 3089]|uniref:Uncharacterized conserved protein YloU, alkaline shock protein (Asp23) family n=1 Tax=Clostridium collagenovorans DSM 3089 TaxID=1121306 RepID=A0A1M5T4F8_9CLOT|nr:Asp23/Gls24 family envelope stress response protein [Clostridium collagenovorans]SHH45490.1 Uncharacterized conserved protein YloU, alkaline shock protein (Asp23) family [Clostridium collagenovorans DSM 3089]